MSVQKFSYSSHGVNLWRQQRKEDSLVLGTDGANKEVSLHLFNGASHLLVEGSPGSGKTAFLRALVEQVETPGYTYDIVSDERFEDYFTVWDEPSPLPYLAMSNRGYGFQSFTNTVEAQVEHINRLYAELSSGKKKDVPHLVFIDSLDFINSWRNSSQEFLSEKSTSPSLQEKLRFILSVKPERSNVFVVATVSSELEDKSVYQLFGNRVLTSFSPILGRALAILDGEEKEVQTYWMPTLL